MSKPKSLTLAEMRAFIGRLAFNSHIGLHVARVHPDGVTLELRMREEFRNAHGTMHGGLLATLADSAAGMAIHRVTGGTRKITTVEMKINFFRPVTEDRASARARVIRAGNTLCVCTVEIHDAAGNLAGAALVTYMILPPKTT